MTTTFPFTICCQMLGVAPKTLRHWLLATQMEPTGDPGSEADVSTSLLLPAEKPFSLEPGRRD